MSAKSKTSNVAAPDAETARGALSASGWLGADGMYSHADDRKIGRAMATSLAIHGGLIAVVIALFAVVPQQVFTKPEPLEYKVTFVPDPGPGGGGGGSPAPAPA